MLRRVIIATFFFVVAQASSFACSCSNNAPIQANLPRYSERAVFTARIVQLMGNRYEFGGKRASEMAIAIVHKRYWGLPWYWPSIVILDGSYPCDTAMLDGEEYLVSGRVGRYGVLNVNMCSRTMPLEYAQVDLRSLDGSHCSLPGGTILGHLEPNYGSQGNDPAESASKQVVLRNADGQRFTAITDSKGVFEFQHLAPRDYAMSVAGETTKEVKVSVYPNECVLAGFWERHR